MKNILNLVSDKGCAVNAGIKVSPMFIFVCLFYGLMEIVGPRATPVETHCLFNLTCLCGVKHTGDVVWLFPNLNQVSAITEKASEEACAAEACGAEGCCQALSGCHGDEQKAPPGRGRGRVLQGSLRPLRD